MKINTVSVLFGASLIAGILSAQDSARGHWTGKIDLPDQALAVEIDLDNNAKGWVGSIDIPSQNTAGLELDHVSVTKDKCTFQIKGAPGNATFTGSVSGDGKTLSGDFTQGSGSFPFKLSRAGEARVVETKSSPPLAKEFIGTWEGTLEAGQPLRLVITMSNEEAGAKAVIVSVDQGGARIPVSTIEQKDATITLLAKIIGGEYHGEINKGGTEINGTWSQGGNELSLKLKKKTAEPAKQ